MINTQVIISGVRNYLNKWIPLANIFLNKQQKMELLYNLLVVICEDAQLSLAETINFFVKKKQNG